MLSSLYSSPRPGGIAGPPAGNTLTLSDVDSMTAEQREKKIQEQLEEIATRVSRQEMIMIFDGFIKRLKVNPQFAQAIIAQLNM